MDLEISADERDLLKRIAESALRELRVEVRRTRTPDYHDRLQREEEQLAGLIERLDRVGEG